MDQKAFVPFHINATHEDFFGNNGINRYVFLCGADERARRIAEYFTHLKVKEHARAHQLYLGELHAGKLKIDVAAISTGMGCPSTDIIVNELYQLGAKRFLRIGTAGSLQPKFIRTGDIVIATAAVRDEDTSNAYVVAEYPAIASIDMVNMAQAVAQSLQIASRVYAGIVHTKSAFFAREMPEIVLSIQEDYMQNLKKSGVLATEMECAHLFILANLFNYQQAAKTNLHDKAVLAGAILAIVGDDAPFSDNKNVIADVIQQVIDMGLETIKELAVKELLGAD